MLGSACASTEPLVFTAPDSGVGTSPRDGQWGVTACASCVRESCAADLTRCREEPTCARRLDCLEACPSTDGVIDAACANACPVPSGSAAERAATDLETCRTAGAGVLCASCGFGRYRSPLLNQACPNPSWDAGPDATPDREACTACGAQRCCESRARCDADANCFTLRDCQATCTDNDCVYACLVQYEPSAHVWNELLTCLSVRCAPECGVNPNECADCVREHCGDEEITCAATKGCSLLRSCTSRCKDDACFLDCRARHPEGVAASEAWLSCGSAKCPMCR